MTLYHYIGANYPLTMGNFGEKYTLKKLSDIPKPDDPSDLRNLLDLSHLEDEWVKVYETELDFSFVTVLELRDSRLEELVPLNKKYIYELGGSFHLNQADRWDNLSLLQANEKCVKELFNYIKRELQDDETIEIYSCLDSEEQKPILKETKIHMHSYKLGESFELSEREKFRFYRD